MRTQHNRGGQDKLAFHAAIKGYGVHNQTTPGWRFY